MSTLRRRLDGNKLKLVSASVTENVAGEVNLISETGKAFTFEDGSVLSRRRVNRNIRSNSADLLRFLGF